MTTDDVRAPAGTANPFIGLRPFGAGDADVFFGRETQVGELLARLRDTRFLAIVGASGCGKSSLVLAGLLPALQRGAIDRAGSRWRIATMRPGGAPTEALATALSRAEMLGEPADDPTEARAAILHGLSRGELGLVDLVYQARLREDENVLVIVDQFEELFRYTAGADAAAHAGEAAAFVKLLLTAAAWTDLPIYVALTMRSDFIGDCARFRDLPEAINDSVFLVPRLTRDEMQRAIEEPVLRRGQRIAPRLVSRLLNDVGSDSDQLPVLEHALMRTWDQWSREHVPGEPLDVRQYEAIGELSGALSQHANTLYDGLDPGLQVVAERVFRCLTARDGENRGIRRPTAFGAVRATTGAHEGDVERLFRIYSAPGVSFLTASGPPSNDSATLDISHESLMRLWDRLRVWVDDEADSGKTYGKLVDDATMKRAHWINPELAVGEAWLKKNAGTINPAWAARYDARLNELPWDAPARKAAARGRFAAALAFLAAAAAAPRRRLRTIALVVGVFFVVAASLASFGIYELQRAADNAQQAAESDRRAKAELAANTATLRKLEITRNDRQRIAALGEYNRAINVAFTNPRSAVKIYENAIAKLRNPNIGKPADLALVYYALGWAHVQLHQPRDARSDFHHALQANPRFREAVAALRGLDRPARPGRPRENVRHLALGISTGTPAAHAAFTAALNAGVHPVNLDLPADAPARAVSISAATTASRNACNRALQSERFAARPLWSINRRQYLDRKGSLDASSQGIADNARCGSPIHRLVNEAYLLGDRAAAKHELGKPWKTDLQRSNALLTTCRAHATTLGPSEPHAVLEKVAADCGTQKRYNERFAAAMSVRGR